MAEEIITTTSKGPTAEAVQRHAQWKAFVDAVQVYVEPNAAGKYEYWLWHPEFGEDRAVRGSFFSKEAAFASAQAVIALKWPEPKL